MEGAEGCAALLLLHLAVNARAWEAAVPPEAHAHRTGMWSDGCFARLSRPPVAVRGFESRGEAEYVVEGSPEEGCRLVARVPSESGVVDAHRVEATWGLGIPLRFQCTCPWQEHHYTPCRHVYAAIYAVLEAELGVEARHRCDRYNCCHAEGPHADLVQFVVPRALNAAAYFAWVDSTRMAEVVEEVAREWGR